MKKKRLVVSGIYKSYRRQDGCILILSETKGKHRLAVNIGAVEGDAILVVLENIITERPLIYDIVTMFSFEVDAELEEIVIHEVRKKTFFAKLIFSNNNKTFELVSRVCDAVALALRFDCPIYINEELLLKSGFVSSSPPSEALLKNIELGQQGKKEVQIIADKDLSKLDHENLRELLKKA